MALGGHLQQACLFWQALRGTEVWGEGLGNGASLMAKDKSRWRSTHGEHWERDLEIGLNVLLRREMWTSEKT